MLKKNYCHDVSAVLVTYNPNIEALHAGIQAVLNQVSDIFIVDNASSNFSPDWIETFKNQTGATLHLLPQEENLGIAAGHNIGIRYAIEHGSQFVLLLDQDSQAELDMVTKLRSAYTELHEKGFQVAALGCQYLDIDSGTFSQFVKIKGFRFTYSECTNNKVVDTDFLISSGSLFPVPALELVGLMDECLFIDHVDTEWCFRAKSKGLNSVGVCGAVMTHSLGEQRKEVNWLFRKRIVPFHKPFRYYYMFRNSVLLYQREYMPWNWKVADTIRCIKIGIFFSWIKEERLPRLKMMSLGVIDGLKGISGQRKGL